MPYYMHDINPDPSPAIVSIQHLSTNELKELLHDENKIENLIRDLQQVKHEESEKEMIMASNKSLAEFNLSQQPEIDKLCRNLSLTYAEAKELKEEAIQNKAQLDELSKQTSLDTTLALLQTATAETEEESEKLAESFLDGELSVEIFLEQFLEKRKLSHLRRIKAEKMAELLRRISTQSAVSTPRRPAPPAPNRRPTPPQYPPRPMPMPMPAPSFVNPYTPQYQSYQPPYPVGPPMAMPLPQYR
ncbi:vacuolar protein sorting-associated protein 37B [Centruroides vittatus]|uniref:vacuolar protein sorting-associated protein 37B n=1 Tax=Centruroides vittatus TaxID=120091 RepID=UPI00350F8E90